MKKANLTVSVYWTRHENDVGHGPPSLKEALPASGTVSDCETRDGRITHRLSQYHMCFGSDQFLERAHMKTASIEIHALTPTLACTSLRKPLPSMNANPVRNANRAKREGKRQNETAANHQVAEHRGRNNSSKIKWVFECSMKKAPGIKDRTNIQR